MVLETITSPLLMFRSSSLIVVACFIAVLYSSGFPRTAESAAVLGNETDRQALLAFKDGLTSDPHGALRSWNQSVHFCQWAGVTCGGRHQRVVALNLDNRELKGPISPHLGNLTFLRTLLMRNNSLEQQIRPELGRLRRLQRMLLLNNSLGGEVPANISGCSNLVTLELSVNNLEGVIPAEIGNSMSRLEGLYVGENNLAGPIPATLANLSSLRIFYASFNNIHGSIPDQFGRLEKLELFLVGQNKLAGMIPPSMFNISSITDFVLSQNQLIGSLPSQLGGTIFPSLDYLDLVENFLHGTIPASISNASNLGYIDLGYNKFTGQVPTMDKLKDLHWLRLHHNSLGTAGRLDDLGFLTSLTNISMAYIELNDNNFGGELPPSIGNFSTTYLYSIFLANNEISGRIPDGIGNLVNLGDLRLHDNRFTGNIPSTIGKLTKLEMLTLRHNRLNGTIPPSFGNLSLLLELLFNDNNLHGTIPSSLGKCINLVAFDASTNDFHGTIPSEIFSLSSLIYLNLSLNRFTGSLPTEVGNLINVEYLRVSDNLLSGKVPTALGTCVRLTVLDMGNNNFGGTLPSSLSSLRGLEVLDLSRNNLSGEVPDYLTGFIYLQSLNLSFNDFEGAVPERGVFKNTTAFDARGNIKLCGGVPQLQLPHCNSKTSKTSKTSKNKKTKLVIGLAVGVTGVVLLLCSFYLCMSNKSTKVQSLLHPGNQFLSLSYQSLLEATNRFSSANLIGVGSFGSVYKGLLSEGQQTVAVKVLNLQRRGASRSFMAECEALRKTRHRNLVKVLTACSSIDHQGNDFKALVYEFMANGSLVDWLHPHESPSEIQTDSRDFNVSQRLDVAIDVASALEYLHHSCGEPIVHCDLKPSNILLDDDMIGHVGDFGLSKFLQEHNHQSSESPSSSIGVRGSVGYVAPEYGLGNEVSSTGDIYSYGILLLELFTGKRPTDNHMFDNCLNLHDYVKNALPEQVATVADPRLLIQQTGNEDENTQSNSENQDLTSSENIEDCLVSLLEVGIACSRELPRDRMTISDAIAQLISIKKALIGTGRARFEISS